MKVNLNQQLLKWKNGRQFSEKKKEKKKGDMMFSYIYIYFFIFFQTLTNNISLLNINNRMKVALFALVVILFAVEGYVVKSHIKTDDEFTLVGRFCFSTGTLDGWFCF